MPETVNAIWKGLDMVGKGLGERMANSFGHFVGCGCELSENLHEGEVLDIGID